MSSQQTVLPPMLSMSLDGKVGAVGAWTADGLAGLRPELPASALEGSNTVRIDLSRVETMDMFGAAMLVQIMEKVRADGRAVETFGGTKRTMHLVDILSSPTVSAAESTQEQRWLPMDALGRGVVEAVEDGFDIVAVQGRIIVTGFNMLMLRGPVRFASVVNQFQDIVLRAIPIVALISLVVGVILTQQSIAQLKNFGATIYVVDLSGILMLREIGILLAAIMIAGRSGSAITAEIGAMRMREEIDALEVMGLDTYRAVVMPRVLALIVGMPLLGLIGAIAGIVGAALASRISGGVSLDTFVGRLADVVDLHVISVGLVKAPIMAAAIAIISVSEGLQVAGSTQSLGRHTTASVVKSIFMVIVLDGVFAVFFEAIKF